MQILSGALQCAEARSAEQTAVLLAAQSRERQAATDAEAARHAIEEARADIAKLTADAKNSKEQLQETISKLQQSYEEAAHAQAEAEQALRTKNEEVAQLHSLLPGMPPVRLIYHAQLTSRCCLLQSCAAGLASPAGGYLEPCSVVQA
eukprot:jgi/Ulvmu1/4598/UM002_0327.1